MTERNENVAARQEFILRKLQESGTVSIEDLCASLNASLATIRRDLEALEGEALLRRVRGGAVPIEPLFYESFRHDASFQDKVLSFAEEKRQIAVAAAQFVRSGQTVTLSGGTTTTELVRCLKVLSGITVITNSVNVAMELSTRKDIEVIVTGGHLRGNWFTLVGPLARGAAEMAFSDILFLGVDGIDAKQGLSCTNPAEAELLRLFVDRAKITIVVADHSKLGSVSKYTLCPTTRITRLITDAGASRDLITPFEEIGIAVTIA